jgi:vancomycin permeability regulator SanA
MKKRIIQFLVLILTWLLIHTIYITIDGLSDTAQKADCILILGNKINEDGTLSGRLQSRVDKGLKLYEQKFSNKIIVSGGLGKEGYYEAREMKKYLIAKGVDPINIIMDDKGLTTYETMINYLPIAKQNRFNSVIIVSQFYHISRSKAMLRSLGIKNIYTAHSSYFEIRDFYSVVREFVAHYWWLGKTFFRNF